MHFSITVDRTPLHTIVRASGELDVFTGHQLSQRVHREVENGCRRLLDLTDVTFADAAALRVLDRMRAQMAEVDGSMRIVGWSPRFLRVCQLAGLERAFGLSEPRPPDPGPPRSDHRRRGTRLVKDAPVTSSVPLDLAASPRDNLYAFGKTWGTFGEDPLVSTFHGAMYASIGTSRQQPLFGYAGTGITKVRFVGEGASERLQMRGKETGFFYDLRTGEVIETWDNPFTGETVEVFPFLNDKIGGELTLEMPKLFVGDAEEHGVHMNENVDAVRRRVAAVHPAVGGLRRRGAARVGLRARVPEPGHAVGLAEVLDGRHDQPVGALRHLHLQARARGPRPRLGALPCRVLTGLAVLAVDADGRLRPRGRRDDRPAAQPQDDPRARRRTARRSAPTPRRTTPSTSRHRRTGTCPARSCRRGRPTPATPRARRDPRAARQDVAMTVRRSPRAPRWSPLRFARQSALGHRRGQTLTLVAVSALITACIAFVPVYDRAMQQALVDTLLAQASTDEKTVTVQSEATVNAGGATEARDPRDLLGMVPDDVAARLGPPVLGRTAFVTPVVGDVPPTGTLVWRDGAFTSITILSGSCPDAPAEIMVSEADAENFGLSLGSTPTVAAGVDEPGVPLEVVGTYEPHDSPWWQGLALVGISMVSQGTDPSAAHDAWLTTEETFVDSPILPGETSQTGAVVPAGTTDVDAVLALGDRLQEMSRDVSGQGRDLRVLTHLDEVTEDVRAQTRQAHRTVPLLMAPMAVLTLFVLWLVLGAATQQRRGEVAVARLRGRGPAGAVGLLLVELLPVLLIGVVPGVAIALVGGAVTRALLPGEAPFEAGPGFVSAVLIAVAALVLTTVAAAVRVAREPLEGLVRSGRVRVPAVGARPARRLPDRRRRDRRPRLRDRKSQRVIRPRRARAPGTARRTAPRPPRDTCCGRRRAPAAGPGPSRVRRDPARDGTTPGDARGGRRDHRGQRSGRLLPRRPRHRRTEPRQRQRARRRGSRRARGRIARPGRGARGGERRRPDRSARDPRHGRPQHPGRRARGVPPDRPLPTRRAERGGVAGHRAP